MVKQIYGSWLGIAAKVLSLSSIFVFMVLLTPKQENLRSVS